MKLLVQAATLGTPHWAVTSLVRLKLTEDQYAKLRTLFARRSTFAPPPA